MQYSHSIVIVVLWVVLSQSHPNENLTSPHDLPQFFIFFYWRHNSRLKTDFGVLMELKIF